MRTRSCSHLLTSTSYTTLTDVSGVKPGYIYVSHPCSFLPHNGKTASLYASLFDGKNRTHDDVKGHSFPLSSRHHAPISTSYDTSRRRCFRPLAPTAQPCPPLRRFPPRCRPRRSLELVVAFCRYRLREVRTVRRYQRCSYGSFDCQQARVVATGTELEHCITTPYSY